MRSSIKEKENLILTYGKKKMCELRYFLKLMRKLSELSQVDFQSQTFHSEPYRDISIEFQVLRLVCGNI